MNIKLNLETLQSSSVEERVKQLVETAVFDLLNSKDGLSATFDIENLKFGTKQPAIQLISMKDVDVTLQWHLSTHEFVLPSMKQSNLQFLQTLEFQAPFQAVISIDCQSDCSVALTTTLSVDLISPGCVKLPLHATIAKLEFIGRITVQYLGDTIILFFECPPEFSFDLDIVLGSDEKLFDQYQVREFIKEVINHWITNNLVHPNAIKLPISDE